MSGRNVVKNRWGPSLPAVGVHRAARSALAKIQHTHTHSQRTQVDCLLDLVFLISRAELISP